MKQEKALINMTKVFLLCLSLFRAKGILYSILVDAQEFVGVVLYVLPA